MKKRVQVTIISLIAAAVLTAADQWSKHLAVIHLKGAQPIVLIPGVFELNYTENRGAAFGLMQEQRWFFLVITAIVLAAVIFLFLRMPFKRYYLPLRTVLIVFTAGTIGNFIDRMLLGYVVDFFYIRLIDFPVFNVADLFITGSIAVFILLMIFKYKNEDDLAFIPGMTNHKENRAS